MRRFPAMACLILIAACGQEIDQSTRPTNIVGEYQLVSYGGSLLPVVIRNDTLKLEVLQGRLALFENHEWSETLDLRQTVRGVVTAPTSITVGSWSNIREAGYIAFNDRINAYQFSGTAAGNSVVLHTVNGNELVYRR